MRPRILEICVLCMLFLLVAAFSPQDHQIFKLRDEITASDGAATTFYDVLGVSSSATVEEVTKALKKKSRTEHPDKVKHSWLASRSTGRKKPGEKKKKGTSVVKGPTEREIKAFMKAATEKYTRLAIIADVLRDPELRGRYDHFLQYGFPLWKGSGYMYSRYRPGLGTVLLGLFLAGGGAAHFLALKITYTNQVKLLESYRRYARRAAFGDESSLAGIAGLGAPVEAAPPQQDESDPMANLNRKQRREYERQSKKEKTGPSKAAKPASVATSASTAQRRRVTAENGKVFLVESTGDVYLEEEDEDGEMQEFLLDPDEIPKPTIWDTAVVRLPIWAYRKVADPFLKDTKPVPEDPATAESEEPIPSIIIPSKPIVADLSSSQISDSGFEIVDSTGIEKEIEAAGAKKRGKKGRKQ
ncbi:hypothetical protein H2200_010493 [Cladophialophora chaetospira]|uniref:J domain-containing protein n=1 Tax=Cladophialophora chaetospira TaxID=386627 RepID=A0AA38X1J5_9EURO|nr:hypothetical protein H2200_010493 [Cladophialophora chaetospira]